MERDFEMFLKDVEEDEELRNTVALYKARQEKRRRELEAEQMDVDTASVAETEETEGDDEVPKIDISTLLDDFDDLNVHDE